MTLTNSTPYAILIGVGDLYLAPLGTAYPTLNAVPGASWRHMGDTQDGVIVKKSQKISKTFVDQETGGVKASRDEESLTIETSLVEITAENVADYIGTTVTDVAAASGTIGTREVGLYSGSYVKTFAVLFRGKSAYGDYPSQYQVPVCYIDGNMELKSDKVKNQLLKVAFEALVNPSAATETEKFGTLIQQDAVALP